LKKIWAFLIKGKREKRHGEAISQSLAQDCVIYVQFSTGTTIFNLARLPEDNRKAACET
jgi:hypothetical protein